MTELGNWLTTPAATTGLRTILSLAEGTRPLLGVLGAEPDMAPPVTCLSGPEGGLSPAEDALARAIDWQPVTLGARVLRAETAALAALVWAAGAKAQ